MKSSLLILFFMLISTICSFSNKKIDDLNDEAYSIIESNPNESLNKALHSLSLSDSAKYDLGKINSYTIQGIVNKNRGFYEVAIENYLNALKICEQTKDLNRTSVIYNNIGVIYLNQNNFKRAIDYFDKALKIENGSDNDAQKSIRLYNLGDAYLQVDSFNLAITYFYNSLLIEQKINNKEGVDYAKIGIATCHFKKNEFKKCKSLLEELKVSENEDFLLKIMINNLNGDLNLALKNYDESLNYYLKSLKLINEVKNEPEHLKVLKKIYTVYSSKKDFENAFTFLEKYQILENKLNGVKKTSIIEELQYKFNLDKKNDEIIILKKEKVIEKISSNHERSVKNYLFVTVVLIALFFISNIAKLIKTKNEI